MAAVSARLPSETGEILPSAHTDPRLVSLLHPGTFAADQYRVLRHMLEERRNEGLCVIAVTSPAPEDGKTLTAINLAACLAEAATVRVLLVDADLRRPCVLQRLGLGNRTPRGLTELVTDDSVQLAEAARRVARTNLYLVASGRLRTSPYEVLKSARLAPLFTEMRRSFDFVVVDTPPIVAFPDYRLIEKVVDTSILVVAAHRTPGDAIDEAVTLLDPAKAMGIVFNGADLANKYYRGAWDSIRRSR
jgi:capsular exopolysaccharide synthesis family protein